MLVGTDFCRRLRLHVIVVGCDGTLKAHHRFASPRYVYFHDFFATERHVVISLQPVELSSPGFLTSVNTFIDSLE
ncbi:MAG: hypothetical protein EXQ91_08285 [Alphaproteobacteria bacterium]|nr:hypothetical protein [Alphaproteobacteria bacterium]